MIEAGYSRDRDAIWIGATGQRFQPAFYDNGDAQHQIMAAILLDSWRRAGIDAQNFVMPQSFILDLEAVSTYPGSIIETVGNSAFADRYSSTQIASPANRWRGSNRGGWANPDFDRAWDRFNSTLDINEQNQAVVDMMKIHSEQLPSYPLSFNLQVVAHTAALKGPQKEVRSWNIHEWEWQ
jgi:ABC-type transport system substrate-binding protein